jgi:hypothetical protein
MVIGRRSAFRMTRTRNSSATGCTGIRIERHQRGGARAEANALSKSEPISGKKAASFARAAPPAGNVPAVKPRNHE